MTQKQLYLVNPHNPCDLKGFPGSLLALKAWTDGNVPDVETRILDEENTPTEDLETSLRSKMDAAGEKPYIGITATTATYQDALAVAKAVKKIRPGSTIILGGHHINGQEAVILDRKRGHLEIDLTVTGEGEKALQAILMGNLPYRGVTSRRDLDLRVLTNGIERAPRLTSEELDSLHLSKFDQDYLFRSMQFEEQNIITARGCPMQCTFCSVRGEGNKHEDDVVPQSPDVVLSQIDYLLAEADRRGIPRNEKGLRTLAIQDNFFAQNPKRAREIAKRLIKFREENRSDFDWNMQTRVEQFADASLAYLLRGAGCSAAYFGVENFDSKILKYLGKANSTESYLKNTMKAIKNTLVGGMQPHIDFQAGVPIEDEQTEEINEQAFREVGRISGRYGGNPLVFPSLSVIYPGTPLYEGMIQNGVPQDIFERYTLWERQNEDYRKKIRGYFAHGNGGIPLGVLNQEALRNGEIELNKQRLERVLDYVNRLRKIPGVVVQEYTNPVREK